MRKLYAILLAIIIFPKVIGAQTSFDSGEGCLNIVDIACRAVPGENGNTGISANYLHERLISEQFSAGAGVKMHITPHMGVTAAICDDAFLVNSFDTRRNDYHTGMVHSLDISLGICFQIPGW